VRELLALSQRGARRNGKGVALITGGAGFIGTNLAARLLRDGRAVRILDNLSRPGTEHNLRWLSDTFGDKLEFRLADVRDRHALRDAVSDAVEVYHFAAQVAVTTSLVDPLHDFEVNGRGTLNLLEELRRIDKPPPLLFTSTNKVYGGLDDLPLAVSDTRYDLADPALHARGIDESAPLTFCSPYGCSKGASDQYVLDFAHTFHLPAAVLRMSCVYGPHQFGTEDQGWVAHFMRRALAGEPIVIYGDGRQVRDILFAEDLVDALLLARDRMEAVRGLAFNIGGGPQNAVSLRELLAQLERIHGAMPAVRYEGWRASDQRYYVSDCSRFRAATGWQPCTSVAVGLEQLHRWLLDQPTVRQVAQARSPARIAL
jgi:CDP-paratose 2-epimerase